MEIEKHFLKIYEENVNSVFRLCYFKTSSREIAQDLTQDTFTKAWSYLADGNEVENLRAFIFTVARNLIKDYYKKKKSLNLSVFDDYEQERMLSMDQSIEVDAEVSELLNCLEQMSESDREILQLRFVEGLSLEELSSFYNERTNTVSVRIYRALKRFRKRFGDRDFDEN